MDNSILYPPNHLFLTDKVIRDVVQRSKSTYVTGVEDMGCSWNLSHPWLQSDAVADSPTRVSKEHCGFPHSKAALENRHISPPTKHQATMSKSRTFPNSTPTSRGTEDQCAVVINMLMSEKARLRELRRQQQMRYRKKKADYTKSLREDCQGLRGVIEGLEQRHQAIQLSLPPNETGWVLATMYFQLFRHGMQAMGSTIHSDFVRTKMARDVVFNACRGQEACLRSWNCTSQFFTNVVVDLQRLDKISNGVLVARTETRVTITEQSLRHVFPHLSHDGQANVQLTSRLVNQHIVMKGSTRFEWDNEGFLTCICSQSNMVTPILELLRNLQDVALVFDKSLISPEFQWNSTK